VFEDAAPIDNLNGAFMSTAGLVESLEKRTLFAVNAYPGGLGDQPVKLIGTTDFNADGQDDFVWYNSANGQVNVDIATAVPGGTVTLTRHLVMTITDPNLKPVSVSDFDGDSSRPDILLFHETQRLPYVAYVNNMVAGTPLAFETKRVDEGWRIETSGNLDSDHDEADIVWRNYNNGNVAYWFCSGTRVTGGLAIKNGPKDLNWKIDAVDDFNGDYHPDLVWRNYATGQMSVWYMKSAYTIGKVMLPRLSAWNGAWDLEGVGDYNGDMLDDLVFRNYQTGQNVLWTMNEAVKLGQLPLPTITF
jgi:hypothetical protein